MIPPGCRSEPKGLIRQIFEPAIPQEKQFLNNVGHFRKVKPWASAAAPCCLEFMSAVFTQAD
jgi:hypothetical protein